MLLSVRDLSAILKVPEDAVYRLVRDNGLPAREINGYFRAHPVDLLQWLADHPRPVNPKALPTDFAEGSVPSLEAAIRAGGVYHDIPGATREDALSALADRFPPIPGLPVEDLRLLLTRRASAGTAFLKDGIAVPHPQYPLIHTTVPPIMAVAFPANPLPFNGNGGAIRAGFALITPTVRDHLRLIGRLIFALHDPRFKELVARKASGAEFIAAARDLDLEITPAASRPFPEVAH
jgi:PTS system nitrogen regulatory IIA component